MEEEGNGEGTPWRCCERGTMKWETEEDVEGL